MVKDFEAEEVIQDDNIIVPTPTYLSRDLTKFKEPPTFSGSGNTQDPLEFLYMFERAAFWNNWKTKERRKEMFVICLTGQAKWWVQNNIINEAEYPNWPFEKEGEVEGLLNKFKTKYVTDKWYELYIQQYEDRKQQIGETPTEYLEIKRYLFQRSGQDVNERSVKQQVRDVMKGLLPEVFKFCEQKIKDPFDTRAKQTLESFDTVAKLLKWAENCLCDEKKTVINDNSPNLAVAVTSKELVSVNNVTRRPHNGNPKNNYHGQQTDNVGRKNINGVPDFEQIVLSKLNKLDKIENDIALLKDRVDLLEKGNKGGSSYSNTGNTNQQQASWVEGSPRCFNCQHVGHFGKDCNQPCRTCENSNHCGGNCPVRFASNRRATQGKSVNFSDEVEPNKQQDFHLGSVQL